MKNIEYYKEILERQLIEITADLKGLGIHNPEVAGDWIATPGETIDAEPDENIAADRREDWQEHRATLSALETRYGNIVRALEKIETGVYGICEISQKPIEEDRLHANPAARTCKEHLNDENQLPR